MRMGFTEITSAQWSAERLKSRGPYLKALDHIAQIHGEKHSYNAPIKGLQGVGISASL